MNKNNKIAIFEGKKIRRHWDEKTEKWFFSVVDIVATLSESENPQVYWRVLKKRLLDEGSNETVTKCNALKMLAADGKMRLTDTADTETVLRIIQSIPSPNAEPFKLWLARVGYERIEEAEDPEIAILPFLSFPRAASKKLVPLGEKRESRKLFILIPWSSPRMTMMYA